MIDQRWALVRAELAGLAIEPAAVWALDDDGRLVLAAATGGVPSEDADPSQARWPLVVGDVPVGFLDVPAGTAVGTLAGTAAERIAVALDRARLVDAERRSRLGAEHARRHVALLRASGVVLGAPLDDPDLALAGVVQIMVPAFADWCAVDVPDGERVRRLAWGATDAVARERVATLLALHPGWPAPVARVIATGRSTMTKDVTDAPEAAPEDVDHLAFACSLGLDSYVITPIRLRGLSVGAISCGTVRPRRGFRASDLSAAEEVASRAAAAVERALLFRESQERADQAGHRAAQLRRLMEAALAVHARHTLEDVLRVGADQARRVMEASACIARVAEATDAAGVHAIAWSDAPAAAHEGALVAKARATAAKPRDPRTIGDLEAVSTRADGWLGAALTDAAGRTIGALVVAGKEGGVAYTDDDESLLVSLAQMASVALESAGLYERARASEARLRALVDASPLGIVELGLDGSVRDANDAACRLFGWDDVRADWRFPELETPAGRPAWPERRDPPAWPERRDPPAGPDELVDEGAALPVMLDRELRLRDGDRAVDLSVSTAPLPAGTDPGGMLVVIADVTERKRLEDEVGKARRMEAVGRMAGGVAHDFNNLLTVVLGHSHLLLRSLGRDDLARVHVDAIKLAGERAASLSAQLLTISKGQMVQPALVALNEVISSMSTVLSRLLPDDVELELRTAPDLAPILADHGQLEQVLLNLVVNARDAMPNGGRLAVTTASRGDAVLLSVADNGEGMTAEVRERCFEPFFSTKRRASAGLGLATVYGIVSQAGGRITVASQPGAGTTLTLEFPAASGDVAARPGARADDGIGGHERVLLIEDDAAVRSLTREMLERDGYAVTEAAGVSEALAAARSEARIDLVITDMVMPDVDGVQIVAQLEEIRGPLPTLFVSGYLDESADRAEGIPDRAFLPKPFGPGELGSKVREVLGKRPVRVRGSSRRPGPS